MSNKFQAQIDEFMSGVKAKNGHETEFLQAVEEVAEAILWLLSKNSSYITGVVLPVAGGR